MYFFFIFWAAILDTLISFSFGPYDYYEASKDSHFTAGTSLLGEILLASAMKSLLNHIPVDRCKRRCYWEGPGPLNAKYSCSSPPSGAWIANNYDILNASPGFSWYMTNIEGHTRDATVKRGNGGQHAGTESIRAHTHSSMPLLF